MKILFVSPYIPNLIRVRAYQLIRALAQRGHEVTLLSVWSSPDEEADVAALRATGVRVIAFHMPTWRSLANTVQALPSRLPLQAAYSIHPRVLQALEEQLVRDTPDVIHVEHLRAAQYGLHVQAVMRRNVARVPARATQPPVVWDSVDCISQLFQQAAEKSRSLKGRLLAGLDLPRTRRYEGWLVHQFDRVLVTSAHDKAALAQLAQLARYTSATGHGPHAVDATTAADEKLMVLANGVDHDYFALEGYAPECFAVNGGGAECGQVVFSGKMSYHANITAATHLVKNIMPAVWTVRPDVHLWIVGKDPVREVQALATGEATGRVTVTGTVPDIRPYLHHAALAVAPILYGAGIQNKVLEAMACRKAVVASPQAVAALPIQPGRELLVADDATCFATEMVSLLNDPLRRAEFAEAGHRYTREHHSWHAVARNLEEIYQMAVEGRRNHR